MARTEHSMYGQCSLLEKNAPSHHISFGILCNVQRAAQHTATSYVSQVWITVCCKITEKWVMTPRNTVTIIDHNIMSFILAVLNFLGHLIYQHGTISIFHIFFTFITPKVSDVVDDIVMSFMYNSVVSLFNLMNTSRNALYEGVWASQF